MLRELLWIANEVLNFPIKNHYKFRNHMQWNSQGQAWVGACYSILGDVTDIHTNCILIYSNRAVSYLLGAVFTMLYTMKC